MLDKSRMILCVVLLTVFVVNPLAPLVTPDFDYVPTKEGTRGRTILSFDANYYSW